MILHRVQVQVPLHRKRKSNYLPPLIRQEVAIHRLETMMEMGSGIHLDAAIRSCMDAGCTQAQVLATGVSLERFLHATER